MKSPSSPFQLRPYTYKPLEEKRWIRIVQLHAAKDQNDPLKCTVIHLDRKKLTLSTDITLNQYCAVSYVWGEPDLSQSMLCEDDNEFYLLKITQNVHTLLCRFRKPSRSINLWIDAISLNQSDKAEISQQVQLMGEIFNQATKVLVWLGPATEYTAKIYAFLRTIANFRPNLLERPEGRGRLLKLLSDFFGAKSFTVIEQFFHTPWFKRRWVLQELGLSRNATIYCGSEKISWKWLTVALKSLSIAFQTTHFDIDVEAQMALQAINLLDNVSTHILDNLWDFHGSDCSDPKDRLYALIGFSSVTGTEWRKVSPTSGIDVDYSSNVETVYHHFASWWVMHGGLELILKHALCFGSLYEQDSKYPSWCPNWSRSRQLFSVTYLQLSRMEQEPFQQLEASTSILQPIQRNGHLGFIEFSDNPKAIFARQFVASVEKTTGSWKNCLTWLDVAKNLKIFLGDCKVNLNGLDPFAALGETICNALYEFTDFGVEVDTVDRERLERNIVYYLVKVFSQHFEDSFENPYLTAFMHIPLLYLEVIEKDVLHHLLQIMQHYMLFQASFYNHSKSVRMCLGLAEGHISRHDIVVLGRGPDLIYNDNFRIAPILRQVQETRMTKLQSDHESNSDSIKPDVVETTKQAITSSWEAWHQLPREDVDLRLVSRIQAYPESLKYVQGKQRVQVLEGARPYRIQCESFMFGNFITSISQNPQSFDDIDDRSHVNIILI